MLANAIFSYWYSQLYPCFIYFPVFNILCISFICCKKDMSMITALYTSVFSNTLTLNHLLASSVHIMHSILTKSSNRLFIASSCECYVLSALFPLYFSRKFQMCFFFLFVYQYKDPCSFHSAQYLIVYHLFYLWIS